MNKRYKTLVCLFGVSALAVSYASSVTFGQASGTQARTIRANLDTLSIQAQVKRTQAEIRHLQVERELSHMQGSQSDISKKIGKGLMEIIGINGVAGQLKATVFISGHQENWVKGAHVGKHVKVIAVNPHSIILSNLQTKQTLTIYLNQIVSLRSLGLMQPTDKNTSKE